jgi:hypothetical protein
MRGWGNAPVNRDWSGEGTVAQPWSTLPQPPSSIPQPHDSSDANH